MGKSILKYLNGVYIAITISFLAGCAESRLPLHKEGLKEFVYKVVDVGYEFDYEIESYKKDNRPKRDRKKMTVVLA